VRHLRCDAYSAEQVLLNKRHIYGGTPELGCYHITFKALSHIHNKYAFAFKKYRTNVNKMNTYGSSVEVHVTT